MGQNTDSVIASIPEIIADLRAGKMVILVDEEDRENEGDLVIAAEFATPEAINFMAKYGRGLICLTLTQERCKQLELPPMVSQNGTKHGTNFTASIEAKEGVTTGISAADRSTTVLTAVAKDAKPSDLVQPGHIFPLAAVPGGVLVRAGHTEAGCDLTELAGLTPASVICEILKEDGTMARLPDLIEFAQQHGLKIGTIADLIHYRSEHETLVERVAQRAMTTAHGEFQAIVYRDQPSGAAHLALVRGEIRPEVETWVRVHEPSSILDVLDTQAQTHTWPISTALETLSKVDAGVLVLLNCDTHEPSFFDKFMAPSGDTKISSRSQGMGLRTYGIGVQILKDLNVGQMRLLARPLKMPSMTGFGLTVTGYEEPKH